MLCALLVYMRHRESWFDYYFVMHYRIYSDLTTVMTFSERTETPQLQLSLLGEMLLKKDIHALPWFQHVLLDLVIVVNAFLSSETYWEHGVSDPV